MHRNPHVLAIALLLPIVAACSGGGAGGGGADGGTGADPGNGTEADAGVAPTCTYPAAPYGRTVGSTLSPFLHWQGYAPGATEVGDVSIKDYFDCDGSKGITAIVFDESALWCGPCQEMASGLEDVVTGTWGPAGVAVVSLIAENSKQQAASVADAKSWKDAFGLDHVAVVADPRYSLVTTTSSEIGLPYTVLVDPRTMKIVEVFEGWAGRPEPAVLDLAQQNTP